MRTRLHPVAGPTLPRIKLTHQQQQPRGRDIDPRRQRTDFIIQLSNRQLTHGDDFRRVVRQFPGTVRLTKSLSAVRR